MAHKPKLTLFPYVPFLFFSIFLAVVGMLTFEYFAHGKTTMDSRDSTLWATALLLFAIFTVPYRLRSSFRKCAICGTAKADDVLVKNGLRSRLCREDLIRSIQEGLPAIPGKWLVFAPDFEGRNDAGYVYSFEPLLNFGKYIVSSALAEYPAAELGRIKGNCLICGKRAEVSFFEKDSVTWVKDGGFDVPDFSRLPARSSLLCKRCAAAKVAEGVKAASCTFENGIVFPDGTNGVLFPWQV